MLLDDLVKDIDLEIAGGTKPAEVTGVACDSRKVRPGNVFVAIGGRDRNGADYIADAVEKGATVVVWESTFPNVPKAFCLRTDNARLTLAELSARFYGNPARRLEVAGITGTNGKTTTAFILKDVLAEAGRTPGLIGTVEYIIGDRRIPASRTTPDACSLHSMFAQMVDSGCKSAVMEVSSHAIDQDIIASVDFDAGIFTNLSRDHLDYHHSMEEYFAVKAKFFRQLGTGKKRCHAVIGVDNEWGMKLCRSIDWKCPKITYGIGSTADVRAENLRLDRNGSSFAVRSPYGAVEMRTSLLGRFNVENILAALSAAMCLGVKMDVACKAISNISSMPGRLEEIKTEKGFQVFVDYAHTDDALKNVLTTLRELVRGRLITVFGCGGNRDRTKRPLMGAVAEQLSDFTFITSDNPRKEDPRGIIEEISVGFKSHENYEKVPDRTEAIRKALIMARDGDMVLVAGKGHENFQEFANTTLPFDDRRVVAMILGEM